MKISRLKSRSIVRKVIFHIFLIAIAFLMLMPFLWMISTSLRPLSESMKLPPHFFPTQFHLDNYKKVMSTSIPYFNFFWNSTKVVVIVVVSQLFTCSMAAYAFSRLRFPGRDIIFGVLLCTLMVPIQVTIIPLFLGLSKVKLVNTLASITLPYLTNVFGVFLIKQFFVTLPLELEEAAKIDGAGPYRTYWSIVLPQAGPVLSALGIITFNNIWNNYFTPLVFINQWEKMTLPLGVSALQGYMGQGNQAVVMAGVCMAVLPVIIAFIFAQNFIIEGISMSGLKG